MTDTRTTTPHCESCGSTDYEDLNCDEGAGDYLHDDPAAPDCFLIRLSTPEPADETGSDAWIHAEILGEDFENAS